MLVYASLYPIPTGFKTITEHRKMCVRDKTIFSNVLSIVKSSIKYYSATYWILNLNLYKDSSVQSQCYIAVFYFIYIYICILLYTHTHIYIYIWFPWMGKHKKTTPDFYDRQCFKVMFKCDHRNKYSFQSFFNSVFPSCW